MNIKKMSFDQLLKDTSDYELRWNEMMGWYRSQQEERTKNPNKSEQ